jgi:hypothetical protein
MNEQSSEHRKYLFEILFEKKETKGDYKTKTIY